MELKPHDLVRITTGPTPDNEFGWVEARVMPRGQRSKSRTREVCIHTSESLVEVFRAEDRCSPEDLAAAKAVQDSVQYR